jgi:hypothetical protein
LPEPLLEFERPCPIDDRRLVTWGDRQHAIPQHDGLIQLLVAVQHDRALVVGIQQLAAQGGRLGAGRLQARVDGQCLAQARERLVLVSLFEQGHALVLQPMRLRAAGVGLGSGGLGIGRRRSRRRTTCGQRNAQRLADAQQRRIGRVVVAGQDQELVRIAEETVGQRAVGLARLHDMCTPATAQPMRGIGRELTQHALCGPIARMLLQVVPQRSFAVDVVAWLQLGVDDRCQREVIGDGRRRDRCRRHRRLRRSDYDRGVSAQRSATGHAQHGQRGHDQSCRWAP